MSSDYIPIEIRHLREKVKSLQVDIVYKEEYIRQLEVINKELTESKKIVCLDHEIILYLKCGHCYDAVKEELNKLKGK